MEIRVRTIYFFEIQEMFLNLKRTKMSPEMKIFFVRHCQNLRIFPCVNGF
jgi:hypothetical protein